MAATISELLRPAFLTLLFVVVVSSDINEDVHVSYNVNLNPSVEEFVIEYESMERGRYRRQATGGNTSTPVPVSTPPVTTPSPTPAPTTLRPSTPAASTPAPTVPNTSSPKPTTTPRPSTTPAPTTKRPTTAAPSGNTGSTQPSSAVTQDNHQYYSSSIDPKGVRASWVDLSTAKKHVTLSKSHRTAVTIDLSFKFRFYGHNITNVTIATGGFLYMSPFLHQWLTATQYIAPLMANFDLRIGDDSAIYYDDFGDRFAVQWRNVVLKDQNDTGSFDFQVQLHADGTIKFLYNQLPIDVAAISSSNHPVKIGLSDAFYIDTYIKEKGIRRRTIYEYHRVSFHGDQIEQGTSIVMTPLPTCNTITDCRDCVIHENVDFECQWCGAVRRCSDGVDWHRSQWINSGCTKLLSQNANFTDGVCRGREEGFPTGAVVAAVLILLVVFGGIGVWIFYAYTHPTSASGMWLMEHRPSQMKSKIANIKFWKSSTPAGTKYAVESTA